MFKTKAKQTIPISPYQSPLFAPTLTVAHGKGDYLYDTQGRSYIDLTGGIAVNALGHSAFPTQIIADQLQKAVHVSNFFTTEPLLQLCKRLVMLANQNFSFTNFESVFVCNSGTEAIETALKFSLLWKYKNGLHHKTQIIHANNSFHGRTMGALSLTGQKKYRHYFEPLIPNTRSYVYNDIKDLSKKCSRKTAALFIEAIQGEGGLSMLDKDTADHIMELKQKYNFLIVADEIQGGLWRTGTPFAVQYSGLQPDIITLAKPLAGGFPIGAVITPEQVHSLLEPGMHGTTFGGNPVICTAANYILDKLEHQTTHTERLRSAKSLERHMQDLCANFKGLTPLGRGHLRGIACDHIRPPHTVADIITRARQQGLLILSSGTKALRLAPSLICQDHVYQEAFTILHSVLGEFF